MKKNRALLILAATLVGLPAARAQDGVAAYRLTALPGLGGGQGIDRVNVIDDFGAAFGQSLPSLYGTLSETAFRPVVWEHGTMYELPLPAGLVGVNGGVAGVNSSGLVVGWTPSSVYSPIDSAATVWFRGNAYHLDALPGDTSSTAHDVNDAGVIVGYSQGDFFYSPAYTAVRWDGDAISALHPLPGDMNSIASAINGAGAIVGASGDPFGLFGDLARAVTWNGSRPTELPMLPGDNKSLAWDINDSGVVVGASGFATALAPYIPPAGPMQPVRWVGGQPEVLPLLPGDVDGMALAINTDGVVVGSSGMVDTYGFPVQQRPVLWIGSRAIDFNSLPLEPAGWTIDEVSTINDFGQIGGTGTFGGVTTAFIATPLRDL